MTGRVLTRYKLLEEVGQGGMAVVYRGLDTSLGREVAVKVLHPHLAGQQESRARLEREAQAVAKLRHENILEIFDYSGPDSPDSYIVTEFIHGPTLTAFLRDHPIPLPEVAAMIVAEVARALEHAHGLGVIHRDIKPENVMIRPDGRVVLTDFGIAQIIDKDRMTVTGQLLGSPAYMSPEHVEGGRLDFRTDVFACGVLLYQLATGQLPFRGKNPHEVLKRIADCQFIPAADANPLVSTSLGRIIARALAKSPEGRHPDVKSLREELSVELAGVGIADPREELRGFFADPEKWERTFRPRLVETLVARGKQSALRGRTAAALAAWSRALAIDPGCVAAREAIDALGQKRRLLGIAIAVAALAILGGASYVALRQRDSLRILSIPPDLGVVAPAPTVVAPAVRPAPPASTTTVTPPVPTASRKPMPTIRRPQPVAAPPRNVVLSMFPTQATVFIDGASDGKEVVSRSAIPLPAGPHTITFRNPCCEEVSVVVPDGATTAPHAKMRWKKAVFTIKTEPEEAAKNAIVSYTPSDGLPRTGKAGRPLSVPFRADDAVGEMRVKVTVSAPGFRNNETRVDVRAGYETDLSVPMERLP